MGSNFLVKSLGINKYNYENREYILVTRAKILDNNISAEKLEAVVKKIVDKSDIFKFTFHITDNGVFELKQKEFNHINLKKIKIEEDKIEQFEKEIVHNEMPIEPDGYLYNFIITEGIKDKKITIYFMAHHSIMDGLGMYNLLNRVYEGLSDQNITETEDTNEYYVNQKALERNEKFWSDRKIKFSDLIKSKALEELGGESIDFTPEEVKKIKESKQGIMNASILGVIRSYSLYYPDDYEKFAIDFAVNLRTKKNSKCFGMFVNILPMFFENVYDCSVNDVAKKVKAEVFGLLRNSVSQVCEIGETYANVMYSYIPLDKLVDKDLDKHMDGKWMETGRGPYDFAFTVFDSEEKISIRVDYKKSKYSSSEVKVYLKILKKYVLDYIAYSEEEKEEKQFIDCSFVDLKDKDNAPTAGSSEMITFEKLLDESFKNNLSRTAVVTDNGSITFKGMLKNVYRYADEIKAYIEEKDPEVIFIYGTPSIESFVMMITAIYAGIPYMFLSGKIPKETILNLTREFRNLFFANEVIDLVEYMEFPQLSDDEEFEIDINKDIFVNTNRVATYFCTSGTTGEPKIIPVKRAGLCNLINNHSNTFIGEHDVSLLLSSVTFDLTEDPIYRTFLKGGTLVVIDTEKIFNEEYMLNCVIRNKVDTVLGTPSALSGISDKVYAQLKKVGSVGEALNKKLADRLNSFDNLRVFNCYGPTEATCYCHMVEITGERYSDTGKEVPMGKVLDNMESYIVDPFGTILPDGVKGELILSGVGVLDNYHNYKGKDSVFFNIDGKKYYKSGDICYFDSDNYYYVNRKGRQVKINGYRIELSAIEEKIQTCFEKPFKVAVVNSMLVLFHEEEVDSEKVIKHAEALLPGYMIPKKFFKLEKLPINKNQKVDVRELTKIYEEYASIKMDEELSDTEKIIYKAFSDILGINNFSIDDNLYSIGGNSLTTIKISNRLKESFNFIEFETVMRYQSVRELAHYIDNSRESKENYKFTGEFKTQYEPTEMQTSMIIKQLKEPSDTTYIVGALIKIDNMDTEIEKVKSYIYSKKDFYFNARYEKGRFIMNYNEDFKINHGRLDLKNIKELEGKIKPFNLLKDSLIRLTDIYVDGIKKYILFEMHHLISDGISIVKLLHDVFASDKDEGDEIYFSEAKEYMSFKYNQIDCDEKNKFIKKIKEASPAIFDEKKKKDTTFKKIITFSDKENENLFKMKKDMAISVQALLSSILMNGIRKTGAVKESESYVVGTPVNLRDLSEVENTIGPMINTIPFVVSCTDSPEDYRKTQENLNYSISNKFMPYAKVVEENDGKELFQIVITAFENYQMPEGMKIEEDVILYPEKFGCTIHIYESNCDIKLVITSNYFDMDDLELVEKEVKNIIKLGDM